LGWSSNASILKKRDDIESDGLKMSKTTMQWIFLAVALLGVNDVGVAGKVVSVTKVRRPKLRAKP
jgi:hypothetical protein